MSLRTKLLLWNSAVFILAIAAFGILQIVVSRQAALTAMDRELRGRALGFARPPGPPQGQPFRGDPPGGPNRQFDVRRPRVFDLNGMPLEFNPNEAPWDRRLLDQSAKGAPGFSDVDWNGQRLRVFSVRVRRPDDQQVVVQVAQETDSLRLANQAQITAFSVVLPLVALVAAIFAALLTRLVIGPVSRLTAAAETIAAKPAARERIAMSGSDEMARLSAAFDTMTDRLQSANQQLEQALESQKRFTGDAAHELRTPLTAISLAAENALHAEATPDDKASSLKTILRSAQSMQSLTAMLLAISRLDSASNHLETTPIDVSKVFQESLEATGLIGDKRIEVIAPPGAKVSASHDALLQILTNLLENASAYTAPGGKIKLRFEDGNIEVEDTGEGIAPEHVPHVFDRFYRADPSRSREKGGYGLGLSICKALAEAQGAALSVSSQVGIGTTFVFKPKGPFENS